MPELPAGARLAFVETAADAREAIDNWAAHALDAAVALEPEATPVLRLAGRPYLALEDAYDPRRIVDLAEPVLRDQQAWATRVDRWLQSRIPVFAEHDFRPAHLYLYWLKIVFDSLAIRAYPVMWALDRWQPAWIWHPGTPKPDAEFGWDLTFRNSLYPLVIDRVAANLNIEVKVSVPAAVTLPNDPMATPHWTRRPTPIEWLKGRRTMIRRALESTRRTWRPMSGEAIVLGDGYDLQPVWRAAVRSGMAVERWRTLVDKARNRSTQSGEVSRAMANAWADACSEADLLGPALVNGCDLRHAAQTRVRFWWEVLVPQQWCAFERIREHWGDAQVAAVAVSGLTDHVDRGAFAALRSLGARTYIYQHGGFVGACECPPWDCNDLALADYELTVRGRHRRLFHAPKRGGMAAASQRRSP